MTDTGGREIETAPKDGTRILLSGMNGFLGRRGMVVLGYWRASDPEEYAEKDGWFGFYTAPMWLGPPTHWMPLPEPPQAPQSAGSNAADAVAQAERE